MWCDRGATGKPSLYRQRYGDGYGMAKDSSNNIYKMLFDLPLITRLFSGGANLPWARIPLFSSRLADPDDEILNGCVAAAASNHSSRKAKNAEN